MFGIIIDYKPINVFFFFFLFLMNELNPVLH